MASASSKKVIFAALAGNSLIAITKFIAFGLTGSSAMLSEGVHSVVDTGNQVLLLYGLRRAVLPADNQFPFGHGKEVYFWSFIVAILIFAVGAGVSTYKGVHHLLHPVPIENPFLNYIVLGLAMLFEGAAWYFALTEFTKAKGKWGYLKAVQRGKDPALFVVLFEDSAAMLGLIVALIGIFLSQIFLETRQHLSGERKYHHISRSCRRTVVNFGNMTGLLLLDGTITSMTMLK